MKKIFKKFMASISLFLLGASSKVFGVSQTTVYGPPKASNEIQAAVVYGPPADIGIQASTINLLTIISSIVLFIIGLLVILNKKIKKNIKIFICCILVLVAIIIFYIRSRYL